MASHITERHPDVAFKYLLAPVTTFTLAMPTPRNQSLSLHNNAAKIHRLPYELLSGILALAVPVKSPLSSDDNIHVKFTSYLISISTVCSIWRNISISSPLLWTTIVFGLSRDIPRTRVPVWHRACHKVQTFLDRSQNALLDVELMFLCGNVLNQNSLDHLLPMFAPHTRRFRSITIRVSDEASARRLFPLQGTFAQLDSVRCTISKGRVALIGDLQLFPTDSECVARPRNLTLSGSALISGTQKVGDTSLVHLNSVRIYGSPTDWDSTHALLRRCARITDLHLGVAPHLMPLESVVSLPYLASLTVADFALPACNFISAPVLTSITIDAGHGVISLPMTEMPYIPSLRSITLRQTSMNAFRFFFLANSHVTSLTLDECGAENRGLVIPLLMLLGAGDDLLRSWSALSWRLPGITTFGRADEMLPMLEELKIAQPYVPMPKGLALLAEGMTKEREWREVLREELAQRRPELFIPSHGDWPYHNM